MHFILLVFSLIKISCCSEVGKFRSCELGSVNDTNIRGAVCAIKNYYCAVCTVFKKDIKHNLNNERSTTLHTSPYKWRINYFFFRTKLNVDNYYTFSFRRSPDITKQEVARAISVRVGICVKWYVKNIFWISLTGFHTLATYNLLCNIQSTFIKAPFITAVVAIKQDVLLNDKKWLKMGHKSLRSTSKG